MIKPSPEVSRREQLLELYTSWKALRADEVRTVTAVTELKGTLEAQLTEARESASEKSQVRAPLQVRVQQAMINLLGKEADDEEAPFSEEVGDLDDLLAQVGGFLEELH